MTRMLGRRWVAETLPAPFHDPYGFKAGKITSGKRTAEGNARVGGARNSYRLRGDAVDFVPAEGQTMGQLYAQARRYFPGATEILNEGDHVHVAQRGYGRMPYFGKQGGR